MAELEALRQGVGFRRRMQQVTGDASVLLSLDPLPSAPVFVPSGPRSVSCDTSKVCPTLDIERLCQNDIHEQQSVPTSRYLKLLKEVNGKELCTGEKVCLVTLGLCLNPLVRCRCYPRTWGLERRWRCPCGASCCRTQRTHSAPYRSTLSTTTPLTSCGSLRRTTPGAYRCGLVQSNWKRQCCRPEPSLHGVVETAAAGQTGLVRLRPGTLLNRTHLAVAHWKKLMACQPAYCCCHVAYSHKANKGTHTWLVHDTFPAAHVTPITIVGVAVLLHQWP